MADTRTSFTEDLRRMDEYDAFDLEQMLQGVLGFIPYMKNPVVQVPVDDASDKRRDVNLQTTAKELFEGFDSISSIGEMEEWETRTREFLGIIEEAIDREPSTKSFDTRYTLEKGNFFFYQFEHCRNTAGADVKKADPIRADIKSARTYEQIGAILSGLVKIDVPDYTRKIIDGRIKEAIRLMGDRYTKALADTSSPSHPISGFRELPWVLESACRAMEIDPAIPDDIVSKGYAAKKSAAIEEFLEPHDKELDDLAQRIADIQNIKDRMDKEGSRFFGDSTEYKNMRRAVDHVCDMAANGMDFSNPDSIADMKRALSGLNEEAQKYADKEAYKTKSTSTGISRKNMALTLIELTSARENETHVTKAPADLRHSKSDKKGNKRSFKELIDEERENNRNEFKHTKDSVRPARQRKTSDPQATGQAKI